MITVLRYNSVIFGSATGEENHERAKKKEGGKKLTDDVAVK